VRNDETHDEKTEERMLDKKFHGRSEAASKHKENKEQHRNCEHQYSKKGTYRLEALSELCTFTLADKILQQDWENPTEKLSTQIIEFEIFQWRS